MSSDLFIYFEFKNLTEFWGYIFRFVRNILCRINFTYTDIIYNYTTIYMIDITLISICMIKLIKDSKSTLIRIRLSDNNEISIHYLFQILIWFSKSPNWIKRERERVQKWLEDVIENWKLVENVYSR